MNKRIFFYILVFMLFFTTLAFIQFSSSDLPDNDGFYHIKMAWLMRTQGLKPDFPWLPLTILNSREFFDHHFLFHIAMIPFTLASLVSGAKWAAVFFAAIAFLSVFYLFENQKIPFAWLWAICLPVISEGFLYRMSIPRAQSLSLGVMVLGITWMLERKTFRLFILSFVYVWMYDAFPLLFVLAMSYVAAEAIAERRLDLRPILWIGAGILLGSLVNPYFPFNLIFGYRHMLPKLLDATALNVGNEWFPYNTLQLFKTALPTFFLFGFGLIGFNINNRKLNTRTIFSLLNTLFFGVMLFFSRRFIEYWPAFVLIFTCFCFSPIKIDEEVENKGQLSTQPAGDWTGFWKGIFKTTVNPIPSVSHVFIDRARIFLLLVFLVSSSIFTLQNIVRDMQDSNSYSMYAGASKWLESNTPAGSLVFQTDWDDFPRLFFYNTHNTYLAGLDPGYFQIADPRLYDLWVKITNGEIKNLSIIIPQKFGAEYIHTDLRHTNFIRTAQNDPGIKEVYRDGDSIIYQVNK